MQYFFIYLLNSLLAGKDLVQTEVVLLGWDLTFNVDVIIQQSGRSAWSNCYHCNSIKLGY